MVTFNVTGQTLVRTGEFDRVIRDSRGYIYCAFTFSDDWEGTMRHAIFSDGEKNYTVPLEDDQCLAPWEVTDLPSFAVSVVGYKGEDVRITTNKYFITPGESGYVEGETPSEPTPDVYAQLTGMVKEAIDTADSVRADADAGVFDGKPGPMGPQGEQGIQGPEGPQGEPGMSPSAKVERVEGGALITVTDAEGTTTAEIKDGGPIDDAVVGTDSTWSSMGIVEKLCPPFEVTGNIVQCEPVEGSALDVTVEIVPTQEGTGDPSPENVRPIVGWDSVNVWRGGKNLLNWNVVPNVAYGLVVTKSNDAIRISGTSTVTGHLSFAIASSPQTYLFGKGFVFSYFTNEPSVYNVYGLRTTDEDEIAITMDLEENRAYDFLIKIALSNEKLSSYEPYRGETIAVALGQTVYGGTLDVTSGKIETNYAYIELDGSDDESWNKVTHGSGRVYYSIETSKIVVNANDPSRWLCSRLIPHQFNYAQIDYPEFSIGFQSDRITICIVLANNSGLSVDEFRAWLSENPIQFVYDTDSYDWYVDAQPVPAISGSNTIYADAGPVTVKGYSDPVTILNKLSSRIAALEDAQTTI